MPWAGRMLQMTRARTALTVLCGHSSAAYLRLATCRGQSKGHLDVPGASLGRLRGGTAGGSKPNLVRSGLRAIAIVLFQRVPSRCYAAIQGRLPWLCMRPRLVCRPRFGTM